jgi:hypothetical protein
MLKSFTRWFLAWFLAAVVLLCLGLGITIAAAAGKAGSTVIESNRCGAQGNPQLVVQRHMREFSVLPR